MKIKTTLLIIGVMAMLSSCDSRYKIKEYPKAERDDVVDVYFGTEVADPYRWLENDTSAETNAWVEAERALTDEYLSHIPLRAQLKELLTQIAYYER